MNQPNRLCRPRTALLALALVAFAARDASADNKNPSPEEIAAARDLDREGVKLARAGNCADAVPKLERARELYEAPVIPAVALGDCLIRTGKIVRGTEILQLVARENLGPGADKVNVDAKASAQDLLDKALPRIAKLVVQIDAPPDVDVTVTIDKQPLPKSLIGIGRPTDPGEHVVEATGPGLVAGSQVVQLAEGKESVVALKLTADPNAVVATAVTTTPVVAPPPAPPDHVPAYVLFGVGGAGLVVGAVTGIMALSKKSTLKNECPNDLCPPGASSDLSSLKTLSWVSTIGFGVGIAGAGAGAILFATGSSSSPKTGTLTLTPTIGLGNVALRGEF